MLIVNFTATVTVLLLQLIGFLVTSVAEKVGMTSADSDSCSSISHNHDNTAPMIELAKMVQNLFQQQSTRCSNSTNPTVKGGVCTHNQAVKANIMLVQSL